MNSHLLYGSRSEMSKQKSVLEHLLKVAFIARESSYVGEYYSAEFLDQKILLRMNIDPIDGDPAEEDFPQESLLLYVTNPDGPIEISKKLEDPTLGWTLLRQA